jgi:hypothetical protein
MLADYPYTRDIIFDGEDAPGLINMTGFRNLLEATHATLSEAKDKSYTRDRAWLSAIRERNITPPARYAGPQASWK